MKQHMPNLSYFILYTDNGFVISIVDNNATKLSRIVYNLLINSPLKNILECQDWLHCRYLIWSWRLMMSTSICRLLSHEHITYPLVCSFLYKSQALGTWCSLIHVTEVSSGFHPVKLEPKTTRRLPVDVSVRWRWISPMTHLLNSSGC